MDADYIFYTEVCTGLLNIVIIGSMIYSPNLQVLNFPIRKCYCWLMLMIIIAAIATGGYGMMVGYDWLTCIEILLFTVGFCMPLFMVVGLKIGKLYRENRDRLIFVACLLVILSVLFHILYKIPELLSQAIHIPLLLHLLAGIGILGLLMLPILMRAIIPIQNE